MLRVGDMVTRKSYGGDIIFRIKSIDWFGNAELVGVDYRIEADAPKSDLVLIDERLMYRSRKDAMEEIEIKIKQILDAKEEANKKAMLEKMSHMEEMLKKVKVLHIDGDSEYLKLCMKYYKELGLEPYGEEVKEQEQPRMIVELIKKYKPDMVVITGHDAIHKEVVDVEDINNYRSSKYFVETVIKAREYEPDMDKLVIFAGACQSHYEALIDAGANFASSPDRILIHALDPVLISERVAATPFDKTCNVDEALLFTFTGKKGLGGYDTRGKARKGSPKGKYKS